MTGKQPFRVAILGTAARSSYLYGPLLKAMPGVELVSIWGRSGASARRLGESLNAPWYTDLERLIQDTEPQIGIVCVSYDANGQVGLLAVEHGLHVLLETPIAHRLDEADAIIATAAGQGLKVEVAEQFHRRPKEQIKLKLIESGLFGKIHTAFNDFAGHGYHGISVLRSYLGFDARPKQVVGAVQSYELMPHWARIENSRGPRQETQEHGLIEFEDGRLGIFHWSDVGYDSALRWWRSSRFLAEKGMGITVGVGLDTQEWLSLLAPGGEAPRFITLERRWEQDDGGALVAMVAHTGDPEVPIVRWDNPFLAAQEGHGVMWDDDHIGVAGCLLSLLKAIEEDSRPNYGPLQARLDQEIILAIRQSSLAGGRPIQLPLDPASQSV